MQNYIKKYFWLLGVITVVVCAVFSARGLNHVVEAKFFPEVPRTEKRAAPDKPKPRPAVKSKAGAPLAARNMFCSTCEPPEPDPATAGPLAGSGVPLTSLPLAVVATNVSSRPEYSFATIVNTSTDKKGAYGVSETIPQAGKVTKIAAKYVDFRNDSSGRVERIELFGEGQPAVAAAEPATPDFQPVASAVPGDDTSAMIDAGVKKENENAWEIQRSLVDKVLENPALVARGARIVPSIRNGKPNGFKLYAIRPDSIFAKIGLMNGDTINAINGFELTTADKALEVYTKVREANNLTVNITRRGKTLTHSYSIR